MVCGKMRASQLSTCFFFSSHKFRTKIQKKAREMHGCSCQFPLALHTTYIYVWSSDKHQAAVKRGALTVTQFPILNRFTCLFFPHSLTVFCFNLCHCCIICLLLIRHFSTKNHNKAVPTKRTTMQKDHVSHCLCVCVESESLKTWLFFVLCWFWWNTALSLRQWNHRFWNMIHTLRSYLEEINVLFLSLSLSHSLPCSLARAVRVRSFAEK